MDAYRYPNKRHRRRHGPQGYKQVASYRPWLRDEFTFRCVYCLEREQWTNLIGAFDVEHFEPVQHAPASKLDYENLLYACRSCNALKSSRRIPDPLRVLLSEAVRVHANGRIEGLTKSAKKLIDIMGLDDPAFRERRRLVRRIVTLAVRHDAILFRALLGFPEELPNLAPLRPPRNSRLRGVETSYYAQKTAGTLPPTY